MRRDDFIPEAPGELVPTTVYERASAADPAARDPIAGYAFVPDPLPPKGLDRDRFVGRLYSAISDAERALAELNSVLTNLPNPELLISPFQAREARLSSRIENTIASAEEIASVESGSAPARSEVQEVVNYLRALRHGENSKLPLSMRLFNELHAILLGEIGSADQSPGEIRSVQNYIGSADRTFTDSRFVPPPPGKHLQACLRRLEEFLNPDGVRPPRDVRYPPVVEAAMVHYQFECIHPYRDGNGRLGRLIAALMLRNIGLLDRPVVYLSAYFDRHRQEYYDLLLRVSTHAHWEQWIRFFCEAVSTQARDGVTRGRRLVNLRDEWIRRVKRPRTSSTMLDLIAGLFRRPVVAAQSVATELGVATQTGQALINKLVEAGVLREITGRGYGRRYAADEVLRIIDEEDPASP